MLRGEDGPFVDHWSNWLLGTVGAQWRITRQLAATLRIGVPISSLGLR